MGCMPSAVAPSPQPSTIVHSGLGTQFDQSGAISIPADTFEGQAVPREITVHTGTEQKSFVLMKVISHEGHCTDTGQVT